jgi:hypothetical protein
VSMRLLNGLERRSAKCDEIGMRNTSNRWDSVMDELACC